MELLASTCKILYDKDYLDSKEKLKKCLFIKIFYLMTIIVIK